MVLNSVLNQTINEEEVVDTTNLFAIDYLKVKVQITNNPEKLSHGMVIPLAKLNDEFQPLQHSYSKQWVCGSYSDQIQIKSINENELLIQGNLYKWLNGQNVTGTTDLMQLVFDTVIKLSHKFGAITPTTVELENIKSGLFNIFRIDLNKALMFENQEKAQQYLNLIKEHATYPRRKREVENNGIYFGKGSKRTTLLYYYKGKEVTSHKKQQANITPELKAYADRMVRCEVRLLSQQLRDDQLQYGHCWNEELIKQVVENYHNLLNLPEPISEIYLPPKYVRYLATHYQGASHIAYSTATIARYKHVLARDYGLIV
jgi:II/X family phage/plasmid replication protein